MGVINTPTNTMIATINAVTRKSNSDLIKLNKVFLIKFKTNALTNVNVVIDNKQITDH